MTVTAGLRTDSMSQSTHLLFNCGRILASKEENPLNRVVNTVAFFSISLLAHALAVDMCVKLLFTSIFDSNNIAQINRLKEASLSAYRVFWLSLKACGDQKVFNLECTQTPKPPSAAEEPVAPSPAHSTVVPSGRGPLLSDDTPFSPTGLLSPSSAAIPRCSLPPRVAEESGAGPAEPALAQRVSRHEREERIETDPEVVKQKLAREIGAADAQQFREWVESSRFTLQLVGDWQRLANKDPRWTLSSQTIGSVNVGMCHFSDGSIAKGEVVVLNFDLKIGNQRFPIQVFGIFDALVGPRAAQFLKNNLQKVLAGLLSKHNSQKLSDLGIRNALKLVFGELDKQFKEENRNLTDAGRNVFDDGSTAIITMLLDGLWTASLGKGRAVAIQDGIATCLNREANPVDKRFQKGVIKRGGSVKDGLVCGMVPTTRAVGLNHLGGVISQRPKITYMPFVSGHICVVSAQVSAACKMEDIIDVLSEAERSNEALSKEVRAIRDQVERGGGLLTEELLAIQRRAERDHPENLAANLVYSIHDDLPADCKTTDLSCIVVRVEPDEALGGAVVVHRDHAAAAASAETEPVAAASNAPAAQQAVSESHGILGYWSRWWSPDTADTAAVATAAAETSEGAAAIQGAPQHEETVGEAPPPLAIPGSPHSGGVAVAEAEIEDESTSPCVGCAAAAAGTAVPPLTLRAERRSEESQVVSALADSVTPESDQPGHRDRTARSAEHRREREQVEAQILREGHGDLDELAASRAEGGARAAAAAPSPDPDWAHARTPGFSSEEDAEEWNVAKQ